MATVLPSPRFTELWVNNMRRRLQLIADNDKLQLENRTTVNTDRGPVRG